VAFVSYRHVPRDRHWAIWIMKELESFRTPRPLCKQGYPARLGRLFRDEDEIPASPDLSDQIKEALARSDNLIVVCSPETPYSQWVRQEIALFQDMGKADQIVALLVAGEPDESFPPELRSRPALRRRSDGELEYFIEDIEPIAADVRQRSDESK